MENASRSLSAVGLFAGIGGIELGLEAAGFENRLLCEIDEQASRVLRRSFPDADHVLDVKAIKSLPKVDVVAGGFPCQDLSLVGANGGIFGSRSGLVHEVFRLVSNPRSAPDWVLLENVPFMIRHQGGHAIRHVLSELENLGYRWAYRTVDSQGFGVPQRRRRVLIVASRKHDPRTVLFSDNHFQPDQVDDGVVPCGFSWTEGRLGLGWAINGVPTLKGGSAVGIPSPPAVWDRRKKRFFTPEIRDAERLQGFPADWTYLEPDSAKKVRPGARWKMVGNAVTVPVAKWIGSRLASPSEVGSQVESVEWAGGVWPHAAYGHRGKVFAASVSETPIRRKRADLETFLKFPRKPLSVRAAAGFLSRARSGRLRFAPGFLAAIEEYIADSEEFA